ncbi:glycerol-3-phosphate 1-O-acyltransferase PlsY [Paremcibacter congregatus]|uniref:Glycerol-3-phosphate acyltransferase n=1 Tax=Paremcibacter congregatus TaxID=2043170 RepID=A0A2G4YMX6_9PROT|nr:glycerol-3-phosphate 1-O-acyltransferase PlsY [Paremcibacter congregatus]PHZ83643.1 acyl-phosphate glycerol 3-phosphate acyltransferase [Paremcibacter congregatus]QDE27346.1 glycerol-3-phosphate 1-O-acyltransferase PlsY [Paremcibacter congregatus]
MNVLINELPLSYFLSSLVGGYLLGSLPFGIILTRLAGQGDLRKIGSGNIGATNVLRTGNKGLALATLLLDSGKGALAVLLAYLIFPKDPLLLYCAGGGAFFGHLYPLYLKFKGGKGVATFLGTLLAINWPLGLACCLTWALSAVLFRISSLSALIAAALSPFYSYFLLHNSSLAIFACILCSMIFIRHAENIKRLLAGTEPKIGKK